MDDQAAPDHGEEVPDLAERIRRVLLSMQGRGGVEAQRLRHAIRTAIGVLEAALRPEIGPPG